MNEKRTHIKKTSFILKNFFNPIQKKIGIRKKQILLQLIRQTIQFIQQKPFLQINRKKTFLLLKKQDRKSHKKKQRRKKPWLYFIKSLKKNHQMNKKTTSNQIRHCTTFPLARTEATTCKKKTESTTKQSHKRTHQKQFSSIKQNFFYNEFYNNKTK